MPKTKVKSHRGARKRFKVTGTGKIMMSKAFRRHILTKKSRARKRALKVPTQLSHGDSARIRLLLA
jgi:large subunit ribosomal protein L35